MAWECNLYLSRAPLPEAAMTGSEKAHLCHLTFSKWGPTLADMMLFDRSSLVAASQPQGAHLDLFSDRKSAVERFKRRLPKVRRALAWYPEAARRLRGFGQFFEDLADWPYIWLETWEFRLNFEREGAEKEFDEQLEFVLSTFDDLPEPGVSRRVFGGSERYPPAWERVLDFCFWPVADIYAGTGDPWGWTSGVAGYGSDLSEELAAYLPGPGALSVADIGRVKAALRLRPGQEVCWSAIAAGLKELAIVQGQVARSRGNKSEEGAQPPTDISPWLARVAAPLIVNLSGGQKRGARRFIRMLGARPDIVGM